MSSLCLYLLGSPRFTLEGDDIEVRPRKALALLVYLAVEGGRHMRDILATLLWPESDRRGARHSLRNRLSELKSILGNEWIEVHGDQVGLRTGYWLDVNEFWGYLAEDTAKLHTLTAATDLYQDDFLTGFGLSNCPEFDAWQFFRNEALRRALASTLERLTGMHSHSLDYEKAIPHARRWLSLDPLHEPAHRQLMQLYAQTDQFAAALRQYDICCQMLSTELGVFPSQETIDLFDDIRNRKLVHTRNSPSSPRTRRHNLPVQTTRFVGRQRELREIRKLLVDETSCRLLNLVGPGGIGKTRLALAAARQTLDAFPDGTFFVPLVSVAETEQIAPAIVQALHLTFNRKTTPDALLLDFLIQKKLLLFLDNFEHLLEGTNLLTDILREASGVTLLVTSRQRLNLQEEWVFEVPGLPYPNADQLVPEAKKTSPLALAAQESGTYDAVQLFLQRARHADAGFAPSQEDMVWIGGICQLVGGMPLALELAAPWVRILDCHTIADEIQENLAFLTTSLKNVPDRHRSLSIIFEQTWERLSMKEQSLLQQLSVFRNSCTREAAEGVTGASLSLLASLVDKALLRRTNLDRYEMHELFRQYTAARLEASGGYERVQEAHGLYFTNFLHQREADLKGRRQVAALDEIEADYDNIRAAWEWAMACKNFAAVERALESLVWFCYMRSRYQECLELLRLGREQLAPVSGERPHPTWGRVLARTPAPARVFLEPLTDVQARIGTALAIAREHNDQAEVAFCLWRLGMAVFNDHDDFNQALAYCQQSLTIYQALEDHFYRAKLLDQTGIWWLRLNQPERGQRLIQQGARLNRQIGDKIGLSYSLGSLGWIAYYRGQFAEAEAHWQEGYLLTHETQDRQESALMLMGTAWFTLFNHGDFTAVRTLAEEVQTISLEINSREGKRRAQILFGFLAGMAEDYITCQQLIQQAAYRRRYTYNISWMILGFCLAACGLSEFQEARQHLSQVIEMSLLRKWPAVMTQCLPFAALIQASEGRAERAVELLALAFHHPLSPKGWLQKWPLLTRLRAELQDSLTPPVFTRAWERGQGLDLEATVQAILGYIATDLSTQKPSRPAAEAKPDCPVYAQTNQSEAKW